MDSDRPIDLEQFRLKPEDMEAMQQRVASRDRLLQFFTTDHLPIMLAEVTEPFRELAVRIASEWQPSPERTVCLRKLLEARDAAVRAHLFKE